MDTKHISSLILFFHISPDINIVSGTNHNGQIGNLSQRVARSLYKRGVFTKSIPEETRTITVPSLSGL